MNARPLFVSFCFSLALLAQGCFLDRSPLPGPDPNDAGLDGGQQLDSGAEEMDAQIRDAQIPVPDGGPDGGDAGERDGGAPDAGVIDAGCGGITPGCAGDRRVECVGGVIVETPCPLGCVTGVCRGIVPSNVGDAVRVDAASGALTGTALLFDTDDGRITDGEAEIRPAGEGVLAHIAYHPLPGGDDAPGLGVFVVGSLNLPAEGTLRAEGGRAFVLLVAGDASIAGTVDVSSNDFRGGPGGWSGHEGPGRGGNGQTEGGLSLDDSGGGGASFGTAGGLGGPSGSRTPGASGVIYGNDELVPLLGGSGGGRGGDGVAEKGGTGGGGGGAVQISVGGTLTVSGTIDAGGAGGGGGWEGAADSGAGGGGGSGGAILLEGLQVVVGGTLAVNGGGGGQGATCGTGCCVIGFCSERAASGDHGDAETVPALGGGTGSAQAGGAGSNPGGNASPGSGAENGGGGGGGAGRIRINAETPADVSVTGTIYPRATTGTITIGP